MMGNRDILTEQHYEHLSKEFVKKIMNLSQEELYELSNNIMQNPNNFDLALVTTQEKNVTTGPGGIDLTADRMKLDIERDQAQIIAPMDLKALENIAMNPTKKIIQIRIHSPRMAETCSGKSTGFILRTLKLNR